MKKTKDHILGKILSKYSDFIPSYSEFLRVITKRHTRVIRINTLRTTSSHIIDRLGKYGIVVEKIPWYKDALIVLDGESKISKTIEHYLGLYYIMDLVSLIPPIILESFLSKVNLDIAAAPGGKALMIAEILDDRGIVIANEPDRRRYKALVSNIDRMAYPNIFVTSYDGRRFPRISGVKTVLFDAPCSSEAHLNKIKEFEEYLTGKIYKKYSGLQLSILFRLREIAPPGSIVLYSVCTLNPMESEYVVMKAVEMGFKVERIRNVPLKYMEGIDSWMDIKFLSEVRNTIRIYPHLNGEYGNPGYLFIALLRR